MCMTKVLRSIKSIGLLKKFANTNTQIEICFSETIIRLLYIVQYVLVYTTAYLQTQTKTQYRKTNSSIGIFRNQNYFKEPINNM